MDNMEIIKKRCTDCKIYKTPDQFHKHKGRKYGVRGQCKQCRKIEDIKYYQDNKEKILKKNEVWRNNNPENMCRARNNYKKNNTEKIKIYGINYYQKNRERILRYYADKYRNKYIEMCNRNAKWQREHPENVRIRRRNYYARKMNAPGNGVSVEQWEQILKLFGNKCLYPGCDRTDITMDHIVPIKMGGAHDTYNVQPLCQSHNSQKHTKTIDYRGIDDWT